MRFKIGQSLFYVNPFVFTIEKVIVQFTDTDDNNPKVIYYIDDEGAWLAEHDLVETIAEAKRKAMDYLQRYYRERQRDINLYIDGSDPDWQ